MLTTILLSHCHSNIKTTDFSCGLKAKVKITFNIKSLKSSQAKFCFHHPRILVKVRLFDFPSVCVWIICREKSEKKIGNEKAKARGRAKRFSNKLKEPQSQQSALWETIGTHNKSLLVICTHRDTHGCECMSTM